MSFGACPIGSNYFYDQLVPHHVNIVTDSRAYIPHCHSDFTHIKSILNNIHQELFNEQNFSIIVENSEHVNVITRRGSQSEYVCVTYSCFTDHHQPAKIDLDLARHSLIMAFPGKTNTRKTSSCFRLIGIIVGKNGLVDITGGKRSNTV